uniref:Uncharacterized protein AlNc14C59G4361 n=1 Tax=Albugo laibachii Nc14 TaxID=890382 RepID=F0WCI1_9STRA|nr:conserved hypothetical protein [Albugo laibachii Nc14]|eukprot:CCA18898.1 conserved hypothetical protein [Albugo laibachii Nc14]
MLRHLVSYKSNYSCYKGSCLELQDGMEQVEQKYHKEDVGRILLQTQQELRDIRAEISARKQAGISHVVDAHPHREDHASLANENQSKDLETLHDILDRAEREIQAKVDLMFRGAANFGQMMQTGLPAVTSPPRQVSTTTKSLSDQIFSTQESKVDGTRKQLTAAKDDYKCSPSMQQSELISPKRPTQGLLTSKASKKRYNVSLKSLPAVQNGHASTSSSALADQSSETAHFLNSRHGSPLNSIEISQSTYDRALMQRTAQLHNRLEEPIRTTPCTSTISHDITSLKFDFSAPTILQSPGKVQIHEQVTHFNDQALGECNCRLSTNQVSMALINGFREDNSKLSPSRDHSKKMGIPKVIKSTKINTDTESHKGNNSSNHDFTIHQGIVDRRRSDFKSFQCFANDVWNNVEEVVTTLERLLSVYFIPIAHINGQRILTLSQENNKIITNRDLLSCVKNEHEVRMLLLKPGQRFQGVEKCTRAAMAVQSFMRMITFRRTYLLMISNHRKVRAIQQNWRRYAAYKATKIKIEAIRERQDIVFNEIMRSFCSNWDKIRTQRRTVMHIPSISIDPRHRMKTEQFSIQQNLQLQRLCALIDENVELIYICPFELTDDIVQYYMKLLQLAGISDAAARIKLMCPENASRFPSHFSLSNVVLCSPHTMKRLSRYIRGRNAYLVPGFPGTEDKRLAALLRIPILGLDPAKFFQMTTHSGIKRCFKKTNANTLPGSIDLYDENELIFSLAKLIAANPHQSSMVLKLDYDPFRTGTALVDISQLQSIQVLRLRTRTLDYWRQPPIQNKLIRNIVQEMQSIISSLVFMVNPEVYPSWKSFLQAIRMYGVVIEVCPKNRQGYVRANLFIEPSRRVCISSTQEFLSFENIHENDDRARKVVFDKAFAAKMRTIGFTFPQTLIDHEVLKSASLVIGQALAKDGICGYISVDFLVILDDQTQNKILYAMALQPFLTNSAASFSLFQFLSRGGGYNSKTGLFHLPRAITSHGVTSDTPSSSSLSATDLMIREARLSGIVSNELPLTPTRSYVLLEYVCNPNVATLSYGSFFQNCRSRGVYFDIERDIGTVFLLADSLTAGVLGIMCISDTRKNALLSCRAAMEAIAASAGTKSSISKSNHSMNDLMRADSTRDRFSEILRALHLM